MGSHLQNVTRSRLASMIAGSRPGTFFTSSRDVKRPCCERYAMIAAACDRRRVTTTIAAWRTSMLHRESERVQCTIPGRHVHLAAAGRQGRPPAGRNRGAAVPQLFTGGPVQRVEDGGRGGRRAAGDGEDHVV